MIIRLGMVLAGASLAFPAVAQERSTTTDKTDDIVVVGDRATRDKQIQTFIAGLTPSAGADSLARFDSEKVCAKAIGLGELSDQAVTRRMRQIAAAANIALARDTCKYPNALVIFADDKDAMIARLDKQYPWLFLDSRGDRITLAKESGPATAWHVRGMVGADGESLNTSGSVPVLATTKPGSRLTVAARPVYLMSVVIIERASLVGLTVNQVADYAAMRSFSDAVPGKARDSGAPTIMTVLEAPMGSETPLSLTQWDLSFLRGLYAANATRRAAGQRGEIADQMKAEIDGKTKK